ncbi:hypothetical protein PHLGIDRAFT_122030 [Phlebiopsis gigantea 11061_1 CR5-6]|uniref:Uncharacterized protein n=1 Tax=Phlebiopsis gigantea (strain 11061_1 CR5-6) TaxID=745531 RepID=A0A0C3RRV9_PHLG1|nr:hypothetical protein PHLGIDRAFT_122030 [Phlebiopsis gigantea 11061_1 CR5-6]
MPLFADGEVGLPLDSALQQATASARRLTALVTDNVHPHRQTRATTPSPSSPPASSTPNVVLRGKAASVGSPASDGTRSTEISFDHYSFKGTIGGGVANLTIETRSPSGATSGPWTLPLVYSGGRHARRVDVLAHVTEVWSDLELEVGNAVCRSAWVAEALRGTVRLTRAQVPRVNFTPLQWTGTTNSSIILSTSSWEKVFVTVTDAFVW